MVGALVEFGVAEQDVHPWGGAALGAQAEHGADAQPEAVAEGAGADLDAGDQGPVGVAAEPAVRPARVVEPVDGDEPLGGEHRVVAGHGVPLGEQEAVPVGVVDGGRGDAQDPVVEHPVHVEVEYTLASCVTGADSFQRSDDRGGEDAGGRVAVGVVMWLACNLKFTSTQGQ